MIPFFLFHDTTSRLTKVITAAGQVLAHFPQPIHNERLTCIFLFFITNALWGHEDMQSAQPSQFSYVILSSGFRDCPSGLQHHIQRRGQPFKNIVVRIPQPSTNEECTILNIRPLACE